jgi:hypothetical protein
MTSDFVIDSGYLIVNTGGDPAEVLLVKRLPMRQYRADVERWYVPILPGLAKLVHKIYGSYVAGLVEAQEEGYIERLAAPAITQAQLFDVPAQDAINRAVTFHLYDFHRGDLDEYAAVHHPFVIGE